MTLTDQDAPSYMVPANRSAWRNTFIYSSDNRDTILGGFWVGEGVTCDNLYSMVEIFCVFSDTFDIQDDNERLVAKDKKPLLPGNYYLVTNGSIAFTNEAPLFRMPSFHAGARVESFFESVRYRDQRCVLTGRSAVIGRVGYWKSFIATHLFPLAYEDLWNDCKFSSLITVPPTCESHGTINSVQNGILLSRDMHALFESYDISINPDDDHKIVCFTPEASGYGIAGKRLDQRFLEDPLRPCDELFRWHFQQAVLVNLKGIGEPCFETDFGSDIMSEIRSGPKPTERMEFELLGCFNAQGPQTREESRFPTDL